MEIISVLFILKLKVAVVEERTQATRTKPVCWVVITTIVRVNVATPPRPLMTKLSV